MWYSALNLTQWLSALDSSTAHITQYDSKKFGANFLTGDPGILTKIEALLLPEELKSLRSFTHKSQNLLTLIPNDRLEQGWRFGNIS